MPIGIRPTNDFAFKKIYTTHGNKPALISLLNAILQPRCPIVDVILLNPFSLQDFEDEKLTILDIKAIDQSGAIYNVEMQLSIFRGLEKRLVYYGCDIYTSQLRAGDDYRALKPAFSICFINGKLWSDSTKVHHAFRLMDRESGRVLEGTLEISMITEDKAMYDAREKAIRDQQWALTASFEAGEAKGEAIGEARGEARGILQGKVDGEIKLIHTLQDLLAIERTEVKQLHSLSLGELESLTSELRDRLRSRPI